MGEFSGGGETGEGARHPEASSRSAIDAFIVMDVMRDANLREAQGLSVVHMEVGQPATPAPAAAQRAAIEALSRGAQLGYTEALGLPSLRARIARHYQEQYGIAVDPARVVVTTGSSAGFVLAFLAAFERGGRVALPVPGYPCYRHIATALGCEPVSIITGPQTRWMPTADMVAMLARQGRIDGLLLASPANPTGTMLLPEPLAEIAGVCRRHGLWFISDEIYHGLTYDRPAQTALAFSEDAIVINSFSKYFSMTGWRVGWMIVPERLVRPLERLQQNLYISAPAISQVAALAAMEARDELERNREVYAANRAILLAGLAEAGLTELAPADGAFYLYARSDHLGADSLALSGRLLDEAGVAVTPGADFDAERGASYLRFSYAGSTEAMREATARLVTWAHGARS
ncbi:MAG: pyridoxal phosphate-dependent aminotransferase [Hyphomicrobiaceae bacterium]